jgi:hypothetical protein
MNKKEFKTKVFGIIVDYVHDDLFKTDNCVKSIDEFWDWINQNYISKEGILNLECLKEEEPDEFDDFIGTDRIETKNKLRKEIKEEIKKL